MSIFKDINEIGDNAVLTFVTLMCAVAPGIGFLFLANHSTFYSIDTVKLIIVALSFGILSALPLYCYLMYEFVLNAESNESTDNFGVALLLLSQILTAIVTSLELLIFYLLGFDLVVFSIIHTILVTLVLPVGTALSVRALKHT